jgi:hypothetical protein
MHDSLTCSHLQGSNRFDGRSLACRIGRMTASQRAALGATILVSGSIIINYPTITQIAGLVRSNSHYLHRALSLDNTELALLLAGWGTVLPTANKRLEEIIRKVGTETAWQALCNVLEEVNPMREAVKSCKHTEAKGELTRSEGLPKPPNPTVDTAYIDGFTVRLVTPMPCPFCGRHLCASDFRETLRDELTLTCAGCHRDIFVLEFPYTDNKGEQ